GRRIPEREGRVAVALRCLALQDRAGSCLDHRHGHRAAGGQQNLGHAQLPAEQSEPLPLGHCPCVTCVAGCHLRSRALGLYCSLISTSTPAERSSLPRASIVCWVGSRMSSNRLCVRISKCSRDFLSTCGERLTVNRSIRVGS